MALTAPITLDRQRIQDLIQREERVLNDRTAASGRMFQRANKVLSALELTPKMRAFAMPVWVELRLSLPVQGVGM